LNAKLENEAYKVFTSKDIKKHISKLKNRKVPGYDRITAEHLKYSGPLTNATLAWLLNSIINIEEIPACFKKGLIIPIPKPNKDCTVKDCNRGITLLPVLYKLFENIIIDSEANWLTNPLVINELQGAGQPLCSCLHTSLIVQEAVAHNVNKGETVYVTLLDTRKAFDTVWIEGLLLKMHELGMNRKIWRLVADGYDNFRCAAYIAGSPGEWFVAQRGVHQGSPLSMWLYQVFINELLVELRASPYGISIGDIDLTCPTYADDIAVLALHKHSLNKLLSIAYEYSRKWRFQFNLNKCEVIIFGKDSQPHKPVVMGGVELEVKKACRHMGVKLCSDIDSKREMISQRIGVARGVIYAAKGLGSAQVPATPTVLSKLYWAIAVPKMIYGMEVTPISKILITEMDDAHRQNAKLVQGLPANLPRPAALATVGWLTLESCIAIAKMSFIWKILCLPVDNIYRRVATHILTEVLYTNAREKHVGPISSTVKVITEYKLDDILRSHLTRNEFGKPSYWKHLIKRTVWHNEVIKWKLTCMLYSELRVYREVVTDIRLHTWWKVARDYPYLTRYVSCVLAVLLGGQPKGLQSNFGKSACRLCILNRKDTAQHILFECPSLEPAYSAEWRNVLLSMPYAMAETLRNANSRDKCVFILSGLSNSYIKEWVKIYETIAKFVYKIYVFRKQLYSDT
jgi:hypothetical protein